jgi:hypothetical protein
MNDAQDGFRAMRSAEIIGHASSWPKNFGAWLG